MKVYITQHEVSVRVKLQLLYQLISTLEYLHGRTPTIMHSDVKPSNVMIQKGSGTLKLIDFGLSLHVTGKKLAAGGSLRYMDTERFNGEITCSSDIFAFGRLVYFMATHKEPFSDADVGRDRILAFLEMKMEEPELVWPGDSGSFIAFCQDLYKKCTAPPQERPDATAVLEILQSWPFGTATVQL
mmetsp:Transcript_2793/g.5091  ORF Transcript_2793/g.5091 Transcript_2793/m.5091 type:complete len:185 (+) Transcript_2793:79-633(+)